MTTPNSDPDITVTLETWPPPATPPVASDDTRMSGDELDDLRATPAGRKAVDLIIRQHFALRDARELAERYRTEADTLRWPGRA